MKSLRIAKAVAFAAILFAPLAFAQSDSSSFEQIFKQAADARAHDPAAAATLLRNALDQTKDHPDWQGRFAQLLGDILLGLGKPKDALAEYTRSLDGFEQAHLIKDAGTSLLRSGTTQANLGNFPAAFDFLNRARKAFVQSSETAGEASVLDVLGQIQMRQGRFDDAQHSLGDAQALYQKSGDERRLAKIRGSLADLYYRQSDYRQALESGFRALDGDQKFNEPRETAKVLDVLGNTFQMIGQLDNAIGYYQKALSIQEATPLKQDIPVSYRNLSAAFEEAERYADALEYSQKSLALARAAGSAREIAINLINIGNAQLHLDHRDLSRKNYQEALELARANDLKPEISLALYDLGNLAMTPGHWEEALRLHQEALEIRQSESQKRDVVWSLNRIALIQEALNQLEAAVASHARSLALFEEIGAGVTDPVQFGNYRETSAALFPNYARVLAKLGRANEAVMILERGRGTGLSRLVDLNGSRFTDLLSATDRQAWQNRSAALSRAANELRVAEEQVRAADPQTVRARDEARGLYTQRVEELSNLRDRLFASVPSLRSARQDRLLDSDGVKKLVGAEPDTLFLEWSLADDQALILAMSSDAIDAVILKTSTAGIRRLADAWLATLARENGRGIVRIPAPVPSGKSEREIAHQIYQAVFEPVEPLLARRKYQRLVILGEGPLLEIPFPALVDANGARLIDRFSISTAISLESLGRHAPRAAAKKSMLAVADGLRPDETRIAIPSGDRYQALHAAAPEANAVAKLYSGSKVIAGPAARESEIKSILGDYEIVHFATHGILDPRDGLKSGLLLATEPPASSEDGLLEAWEISSMPVSARLAVLSACNSARGNEQLGDGLMGLAWAFQAAGVPRVVASLWNVDDDATRDLMISFYTALKSGSRVDDALREAARKLRQDKRYESPYFWAAFQLIGEPGRLREP